MERTIILAFIFRASEYLDRTGLRKTLAEEFSSIYVFHLRGNQRCGWSNPHPLAESTIWHALGNVSRKRLSCTLPARNLS